MLNLKTLVSALLLITTPSFLIYPQENITHGSFQVTKVKSSKKKSNRGESFGAISKALTYDEILELVDKIESGCLEKNIFPTDIENINQFIVLLAQQGVYPHRSAQLALEEDIHDLLSDNDFSEYANSLDEEAEFILIPTIFNKPQDIQLCKSWTKKQWKKTKKFIKKHKKEIIIGAAIVVAAVVVVTAVTAASIGGAAAAATAAGASGAAFSGSNDENKSCPPSDSESPSISSKSDSTTSVLDASEQALLFKANLDQYISSFKDLMIEDPLIQQLEPSRGWDDLSFGEKAREYGAYIAHEALQGISELARIAPKLCEELEDIGARLLPEGLILPDDDSEGGPMENYNNLLAKGHQSIDNVFSTDQAELFTEEFRAHNHLNKFTLGIIPLPGMISGSGAINVKGFSDLGKVTDRANLTKAGRAVMKHGNREGRTVFPKPYGNPAHVNQQGQVRLEQILNHPDNVVMQYVHHKFGPVIEIEAPELGGVRFTGDGKEMMGFLEPYWLKQKY